MVDFKLTISEKAGKSYQTVINDPDSKMFMGKKIGDKVSGETINLAGYELLITGGSDSAGFPMRKDVSGSARKKILAVKGIGLKKKGKGTRQRKTVCGNTIHESISQINLQVVKEGSKKLADAFGSKEGEGKEVEEKAPKKEEAAK
jgi:small subunit ribosomal protein S6e